MAKILRDKNDWNPLYVNSSTEIKWNVTHNPKRSHGASYARFQSYLGSSTVEQYLANGGTRGDLRYDWTQQFIDLIATESKPVLAGRVEIVGNKINLVDRPIIDPEDEIEAALEAMKTKDEPVIEESSSIESVFVEMLEQLESVKDDSVLAEIDARELEAKNVVKGRRK